MSIPLETMATFLQVLVSAGGKINDVDKDGNTALMQARLADTERTPNSHCDGLSPRLNLLPKNSRAPVWSAIMSKPSSTITAESAAIKP